MAKTSKTDAGMEAEGGATGALTTFTPKHPQPHRAKLCSGPQNLPWGGDNSCTYGLAFGGAHAEAPL